MGGDILASLGGVCAATYLAVVRYHQGDYDGDSEIGEEADQEGYHDRYRDGFGRVEDFFAGACDAVEADETVEAGRGAFEDAFDAVGEEAAGAGVFREGLARFWETPVFRVR